MNQVAPIKNMMQMLRGAQNPSAMLNQMLQRNPQYSRVMNVIQQNGGDAQKAFYAMAKQLGINGDDIINMLK